MVHIHTFSHFKHQKIYIKSIFLSHILNIIFFKELGKYKISYKFIQNQKKGIINFNIFLKIYSILLNIGAIIIKVIRLLFYCLSHI